MRTTSDLLFHLSLVLARARAWELPFTKGIFSLCWQGSGQTLCTHPIVHLASLAVICWDPQGSS